MRGRGEDAATAVTLTLPVHSVHPRPGNRAATGVAELAESIRDKGLLNPILVRRKDSEYELIGGERRWRAHLLLGFATIDAHVYDETLPDDEAEELGEVDNLQRRDLTPIEEAEAYERLLELCGSTAEVARRVGRSETNVRQRMMLVHLVPEIRAMVDGEALNLGAAEVIAQQHQDVQRQILVQLERWVEDGDRISNNDIAQLLEDHLHDLASAPFNRDDSELVPGAPACGSCPRRTGRQGTLLDVIDKSDVCLDGKCWDTKVSADAEAKIAAAKKRGLPVLSPTQVKQHLYPNGRTLHTSEYVATHETIWTDGDNVVVGSLVDDSMPRAVALTEAGFVDLVKRADVFAKAKAASKAADPAPAKAASKSKAKTPAKETAHQREERERKEKVALQKRTRDIVLEDVRGRVEQGKLNEELVLQLAIASQHGAKGEVVAKARGKASIEVALAAILEDGANAPILRKRRLLALLAELAIADEVLVGPWSTDKQATPPALEKLGIDLATVRRAAAAAIAVGKAPKSPKAPPAKSKPKPKAKPAKKGKR